MSAELNSADLEEPITDNQSEAAGATPDVAAVSEPVEETSAADAATAEQPEAEQEELLAIVGTLRPDIVEVEDE